MEQLAQFQTQLDSFAEGMEIESYFQSLVIPQLSIPEFGYQAEMNKLLTTKSRRVEIKRCIEQYETETREWRAITEQLLGALEKDQYTQFLQTNTPIYLGDVERLQTEFTTFMQKVFSQISAAEGAVIERLQFVIKMVYDTMTSRQFIKESLGISHYTESTFQTDREAPSIEYRAALSAYFARLHQNGDFLEQEMQNKMAEDIFQLMALPEAELPEIDVSGLEIEGLQINAAFGLDFMIARIVFEFFVLGYEFDMSNSGTTTSDGETIIIGPLQNIATRDTTAPTFVWYL